MDLAARRWAGSKKEESTGHRDWMDMGEGQWGSLLTLGSPGKGRFQKPIGKLDDKGFYFACDELEVEASLELGGEGRYCASLKFEGRVHTSFPWAILCA